MRSATVRWLRNRLFGHRRNDWQSYHEQIASELRRQSLASQDSVSVLEIGCGRGVIAPFPWEEFPAVRRIGLDTDESAAQNKTIQEFRLLEAGKPWPIESSSVDLALARYVLEHLDSGARFFGEIERVLKPGGRLVFLTPNRFHPAVLLASILGHSIKTRLLSAGGLAEIDVFPAYYRLNSRGAIRTAVERSGLRVTELTVREYAPVSYLDFILPGFLAALILYCLLRWTWPERYLGASITGVVEKSH